MNSSFAALYAGQYDALYIDKSYASECDLIEKLWNRHGVKPRAILDIGCGTGNHAIELAHRGYDVTGIDLSPSMIDLAQQKARGDNDAERVDWHVGDARSFDIGRTFDAAIMMFAVIGYLTTNDDLIAGLKNARRHLKPGALFICDFWYGPAVLSVRPSDRFRVIENDGCTTLRAASTTINSFAHTADVTFRLWNIEGDRFLGETHELHKMRYLFPQEVHSLFQTAGFEISEMAEFPSLDALTDDTWNAICAARAI
ncbi:MAG: class I SAM-dependent methyltransferase [Bdellovibrionales bacterium]|nr:class I SAM-dependent methyltransferase [Bdellovibrionales bacterium]